MSITSTASYTLDDQIQVYGNNTYTYDDAWDLFGIGLDMILNAGNGLIGAAP